MKTCVVLALFLMAGVSLGDIQKRIKGGRACTADETTHFVFLGIKQSLIGGNGICAGTIIENGNWILTAKHCEEDKTFHWFFRWLFPINIKDVTSTLDVTSRKTFKHETADVMLIKVKTGMTGMPLMSEADCSRVMNQINTKPVKMVVPARDTQARIDTGIADVSMCADIDVDGVGLSKTKEKIGSWIPGACHVCGGDSGAGVIYNNTVFAVITGSGMFGQHNTVKHYGHIVCDGNIRNWIVTTMNNNP
ncbi:snake venom serine protease 3-like isoform X1 [Cololabis saira]|uniref:snake venom serine protease 3-like isoform X1 n=1 Tax=Cololabis saira TaxID=129043 RepID=UPI002AD3F2D5|nr:snake venom serine protease 3-like isoform X1 [Cololabis saira]